jgi:putative flippase GtrA
VEIIKPRFVKYSMIGGASAIVDWGLFYLLAIILDLHYILSGTISFTLATLFNYFIGITFLFDSTARFTKQNEILLVFLISLIGLAINLLFLFLFSSRFLLSLMGSKILASFFTLVWNFSMRNYYIFRKV